MKLELKHLAPYLPYGLKLKSPINTNNIPGNRTYEMFEDNNCFSPLIGISDVIEYQYRPILRPLSDLNKFKDKLNDEFYADVIYKNETICLDFKDGGIVTLNLLAESLEALEFLFENHFDVFGLIGKGLAIDINTI